MSIDSDAFELRSAPKRDVTILFLATAQEREILRRRAADEGMSVADLIRRALARELTDQAADDHEGALPSAR